MTTAGFGLSFTILKNLGTDGRLLFATRITRMFAYGFLSVGLVIYLAEVGFSETQIGLLLTLTLLGDTLISLGITTHADRWGRRRMLILGAVLMLLAGAGFVFTRNFILLLIAATIGVISPSGNEVGPFLPIEQAALTQIIADEKRTKIFAWYNLMGSLATAFGALFAGWGVQLAQKGGLAHLESYRIVLFAYAAMAVVLGVIFLRLSPDVEIYKKGRKAESSPKAERRFGLHRSKKVVFKLSALFSLDAFAGGFVMQSIVAYWFHVKFRVPPVLLGGIFFGANILAGLSALAAAWVASKIGLIRTMVFTHIPSNILLILVPLMPDLTTAIAVLLLRFSISQMDVPTRQSYTMAVVSPDERSAAAGITGIARTIGASLSPIFTGPLLAHASFISFPFFISGFLKIGYDLLLYRAFRSIRPPEENVKEEKPGR
jgi:MFS family permease